MYNLLKKQKKQFLIASRFYSKLEKKNNLSIIEVNQKNTKMNLLPVQKKNIIENKANNQLALNLVGETKHYPPANKEWTNSVYTYNKKGLRSLSVKDDMARKLIKSFFNLHAEKTIARSKRMRSLIRKSTAKKLFLSKPEIKQTNDKVIITVYTFDRERQYLLRKLYFKLSKWEGLKKINLKIKKLKKIRGKALKTRASLLKNKASRKRIIIIKKKIIRKAYFSEYDKWRVKSQLKTLASKKEKVMKTFKKLALKKANYYLENISLASKKEKKLLANFKKLGVKRFNYPLNKNIVKAKWLESYALTQGYNKVISFKIKIPTIKKNKIRVKKKIKTLKGIRYIKVTRYKKKRVIFKKRVYFRVKDDYTNLNYFLNRKRNFYPKKVNFVIKPWLRKTSKIKSFNRLIRKRNLMFIKRRLKKIKKNMPFFGFKLYNQMDFSKFKINNKRLLNAKRILLYFYIAYMFSLFKIKMLSFEDTLKVSRKKLKKLKKEDYDILEKPRVKKNVVISKKEKNILIKKKVPFYVRRFQNYKLPFNYSDEISVNFYYKRNKFTIKLKKVSFDNFIHFLLALLKNMLISVNSIEKIKTTFNNFSKKYFLNVFYKSLFYVKNKKKLEKNLKRFNKNVLIINSLVKLAINQTKFGKFLPKLKLLISKIYSKKTELNIVNLKSPHLNTDIFTEAVAVKLKKRVGLLRVMRRSLQLVKLPYKFKKASEGFSANKLEVLNRFKWLNLNNLKENLNLRNMRNYVTTQAQDSLQETLKTLYPRSFSLNPLKFNNRQRFSMQNPKDKKDNSKLNKLSGVFNTIKYKWVTGVRLEAAGRLTRRYTASRSVFKFRQKGSLKNTDFSKKLDFLNNSMPNVILRNIAKSNSQHSFLKSKKRIGAFGLKTWMSSY